MGGRITAYMPQRHPSIENILRAPFGVFSEGAFANNLSS